MHQLRFFLRSEPSICRFLSEMVAEFGLFLGDGSQQGRNWLTFSQNKGLQTSQKRAASPRVTGWSPFWLSPSWRSRSFAKPPHLGPSDSRGCV